MRLGQRGKMSLKHPNELQKSVKIIKILLR